MTRLNSRKLSSSLDFWKIRQQKSTDLTKAGEVQLSKNIDPSNPFNDGDSNIAQHNTQGRYKNIDSNVAFVRKKRDRKEFLSRRGNYLSTPFSFQKRCAPR